MNIPLMGTAGPEKGLNHPRSNKKSSGLKASLQVSAGIRVLNLIL